MKRRAEPPFAYLRDSAWSARVWVSPDPHTCARAVAIVALAATHLCGCSGDDSTDPGGGAGTASAAPRPPAIAELFGGCGRAIDGSYWCFGTPSEHIAKFDGVLDVSSSGSIIDFGPPVDFDCAVNADGLVACEGSDVNGMLGFPTNTVATCSYDCTSLLSTTTEYCGYPCQQALSNVPGLAPAVRVSAPAGPCALGGDGAVQCWGGEDSQGNLVAPYTVALPGAALRIAGGQGACALLQTGALACWDGPIDAAGCPPSGCALPAIVPDLDDLTDLSIAIGHGCVVRADGTAFCWGTSTAGELGDGTNTNRATPVQVSGPLKLTGISTDFAVTWAITDGGGIATWGVSVAPPGVDGTSECDGIACRVEPVAVPGISNVKQVSSGGGGLGYALLVDGSVLQIDENEHGFVLTQVAP